MAPDSPRAGPPATPPRDPMAPARLLDAAGELSLRVERAQRQLDQLEAAIERLGLAAGGTWPAAEPEPAPPDDPAPAHDPEPADEPPAPPDAPAT